MPHTSPAPFGFGMHGRPLQQSALDAHVPFAFTQPFGLSWVVSSARRHRGTPSASWRHVHGLFCVEPGFAEQQFASVEQDAMSSLQTPPAGRH